MVLFRKEKALVTTLKKIGGEKEKNNFPRTAQTDSSKIQKRSFDQHQIDELKSDPDLRYKEEPTIAESLWSRFDSVYEKEICAGLFDLIEEEPAGIGGDCKAADPVEGGVRCGVDGSCAMSGRIEKVDLLSVVSPSQ